MSFSYKHVGRSSRNHFVEPPPLIERVVNAAPVGLPIELGRPPMMLENFISTCSPQILQTFRSAQKWLASRRIRSLPNVLIILWLILLYWGEILVFRQSVAACHWSNWEQWGSNARPHHLILVADPQLVDPHTYPGRPWPLSTFTVHHTDLYLRRSYSLLQDRLQPDTVFFLGDLFDGGREWSTDDLKKNGEWAKYGETFWLEEYNRFGQIFFGRRNEIALTSGTEDRGKKVIASLPGNHDLGIGVGVKKVVRDRFYAYFGDGNRVDIVGNHTFVSVDTVSLSAMGQSDPLTASQGAGLGDGPPSSGEMIWKPVKEFLDRVKLMKKEAVARELRYLNGDDAFGTLDHDLLDLTDEANEREYSQTIPRNAEFPTILLTHVPLYRAGGTPCGPLREHWPPSKPPKGQATPLDHDDRNAIAVRGGYQYQNVLTPDISKELITKIGGVQQVFSGDDHDYCEVIHKSYTSSTTGKAPSGIREITVKSISWAMGVRKPGFLMMSLWNPVDEVGKPIEASLTSQDVSYSKAGTIQTHLCLLPDQLSIFIRYGMMGVFTVMTLAIRAIYSAVTGTGAFNETHRATYPLLPLTERLKVSRRKDA